MTPYQWSRVFDAGSSAYHETRDLGMALFVMADECYRIGREADPAPLPADVGTLSPTVPSRDSPISLATACRWCATSHEGSHRGAKAR